MEKLAFLRCAANQVCTGHKHNFHPKNPTRAKLAATNKKMTVAQVSCDADRSEMFHIIYPVI